MSLTREHSQRFNLSVTKDGIITRRTYAFPLDETAIKHVFKSAAAKNVTEFEKRLLNSIRGIKLLRLTTHRADAPHKLHGSLRDYYPNGMLHRQEEYTNGLRNGLCETYSRTGQRLTSTHYKFGQRNGIHEEYAENGNFLLRAYYKQGRYHGPVEVRHPNGVLKMKGAYEYDQLHGAYESRDEDNNTLEKGTYEHGQKADLWHYPHDKESTYVWYMNGEEIASGEIREDVLKQALQATPKHLPDYIQLEIL